MSKFIFPNRSAILGDRLGITLRDYIATQVLSTIMGMTSFREDGDWDGIVTQRAYEIADAMLKAKEAIR